MSENREYEEFINRHISSDVVTLRLKYAGKHLPFDLNSALIQIECRQKIKSKLPFLLSYPNFIFPSVLASEQSTAEDIARFHASLIPENAKVLDLTCGLGIDSYFISRNASSVTTFDLNPLNAEIAQNNFKTLGSHNIDVKAGDSIEWLRNHPEQKFDIIFADPSRRGDYNSRLFALSDCSPDIPRNLDLLKQATDRLIVKASPMLDITQVCRELPYATRIWCVSKKHECKELLIDCDFKLNNTSECDPLISAINFENETSDILISYHKSEIPDKEDIFTDNPNSLPGKYLYLPEAALQKSGGAPIIARSFNLKKLHPNTWIYVSEEIKDKFPGRILKIDNLYTINDLKSNQLKGLSRNVVSRNFPLNVSQIISKGKIKEGSNSDYLICCGCGIPLKPYILDCKLI